MNLPKNVGPRQCLRVVTAEVLLGAGDDTLSQQSTLAELPSAPQVGGCLLQQPSTWPRFDAKPLTVVRGQVLMSFEVRAHMSVAGQAGSFQGTTSI
jgi:hypothetical protein